MQQARLYPAKLMLGDGLFLYILFRTTRNYVSHFLHADVYLTQLENGYELVFIILRPRFNRSWDEAYAQTPALSLIYRHE